MNRIEANKVQDWHRIDIVAALHKRGVSIRQLSIQAGLKPDTLKNALARPYPKGERIIADAIGMDPDSIWPSRYPSLKKAS
ncbi:helix-turn-helix domain-containing protein [Enterobacter cloacae]